MKTTLGLILLATLLIVPNAFAQNSTRGEGRYNVVATKQECKNKPTVLLTQNAPSMDACEAVCDLYDECNGLFYNSKNKQCNLVETICPQKKKGNFDFAERTGDLVPTSTPTGSPTSAAPTAPPTDEPTAAPTDAPTAPPTGRPRGAYEVMNTNTGCKKGAKVGTRKTSTLKECKDLCDDVLACQFMMWSAKPGKENACNLYAVGCQRKKGPFTEYNRTGLADPTSAPTTAAPTDEPTAAPTTAAPTNSPTTAAPTKTPTNAPTASPTRPYGNYTVQQNQDCSNKNQKYLVTVQTTLGFDACARKCDLHNDCFAFVFKTGKKGCRLLAEMCALKGTKGSRAVTRVGDIAPTGSPTNEPTAAPTTASPTNEPTASPTRAAGKYEKIDEDRLCRDTKLTGSKADNIAACQEKCDLDNSCNFMYWRQAQKLCFGLAERCKEKPSSANGYNVFNRTGDATAAPTVTPPTDAPTTGKPTVAPPTDAPTTAGGGGKSTDSPTASPTTPEPTAMPRTEQPTTGGDDKKDDSLTGGQIGGIAVGAIAGLGLIGLGAMFLMKKEDYDTNAQQSAEQELTVSASTKSPGDAPAV